MLCVVAAGIGLAIAAALSPMIYRQIGAGGMSFPLASSGRASRCRPSSPS